MDYSNKQILEAIINAEKNLNTNSFLDANDNFWPAIRIRIAFSLIKNRYKEIKFKNSILEIFFLYFILIFHDKKQIFLFVTHKNYKVSINGKIYDRVLEKYIQDCINKKLIFALLIYQA